MFLAVQNSHLQNIIDRAVLLNCSNYIPIGSFKLLHLAIK